MLFRSVLLGDKEIVINTSSALGEIENEGLFEGDTQKLAEPGFAFSWRLAFYACAAVFAATGGFVLTGALKKRKTAPEAAYELFLRRYASLSAEDENYFVALTFFFKEYMGSLCGRRIIGKTTAEIVGELQFVGAVLPELEEWLTECDRFKFAGVEVSFEQRHSHSTVLLGLVKRIEAEQKDKNGGTA